MSANVHLLQDEQYPPALINVEAEAGLLGALMINNGAADRVAETVKADDFYEGVHQRIFASIIGEISAGRSASAIVLRNHFIADEDLKDLGGAGYLAQLTASSTIAVGVMHFAQQIADLAKRRRLLDEMRGLQADLTALTDKPVESLVDSIDNALSTALQRAQTTRSSTLAQAWDRTIQGIEDEAAGLGPQGIRISGLDDFNDLTGDLRRGDVMILGGRPSMGKTALALEIALGAARGGNGTLLVSLEMRTEQVMVRAITDLIFEYGNSPSLKKVMKGDLTQFDRDRLRAARAEIDQWPMIITDPAELSIGRLAMMIRRYQRQMAGKGQTLDMVIVDYLQLIKGPPGVKRYEEVAAISRTLKAVAKECDVAMVVLAQLNRECEKREDKRPQLSDLRDAGDIEQDADIVMFVFREQYYLERTEPEPGDKKRPEWDLAMAACRDRVELITAKVRQGRIGKRMCYFFGEHQAVRGSHFMRDMHQ